MTCIDEHLLQQYIDNECPETEREMINEHLSICPACQKKQLEMTALSIEIKDAICSLGVDNLEVPVFKNTKTLSLNRNIKLLIYSLSAACIVFCVLFFVDKKTEASQKQITIVQSIPSEVDANRPASDQDFVIEVYDGKGQRSEYLVE